MHSFTSQQHDIINNFGKGQAVIAGAGCGKTTTLVAKCLALLKSDKKATFCAVSFTEKSVRDLKEALAKGLHEAGLFEQRRNHWVKTIHGLCATVIKEFPTAAGLQGGERILVEDESSRLWERSMNALWSTNESKVVGDAVISLLKTYSKTSLESLLLKLKNLISFGVEEWIQKSIQGPLARDDIKNLWICFESVHRRYVHSKSRMGAMDFNDLEIFALKALEQDWVCKHFHKMFKLVLVDEFQDTNPVQGKILERFAQPGLTNLCIVGDPKQSIYRFRDADVSVFFDLTQRMPMNHLLTENYRSHPGIIQFVNEVCSPVFEASALAYEPLTAGLTGDDSVPVWRLVVKTDHDLSNYLRTQMDLGVDLSEYAILARSLKGKTQKILQSLNQAGIPYILGTGGRFYADPRVQELVYFLKGFCSAAHRQAQWSALRSPWVAVEETLLLQWKDDFYENFFKSEHPIARKIKFYYSNSDVRPGEILEALLELLDEEMSVPVLTLWHKAETLSAQGLRFEEVVETFSNAIDSDKLEKEIPPPAQKGAIRVMTIHGSKGLQFPRVILADFTGPNRGGRGFKDLIWDRKRGVHLFHRDEDGTKNKEEGDNLFWDDLEKQNAVAESKRLFYVAITRPQKELILYWPETAKPSKEPLKSDDWRSWVEGHSLPLGKDFSELKFKATDKVVHNKLPPIQKLNELNPQRFETYRPRHSPSEWRILSQCGLHYYWKWVQAPENFKHETFTAVELDETQLKKQKWNELASEKGARVHELLEVSDWDALKNIFDPASSDQCIKELISKLEGKPQSLKIYREFAFEIPLNADEGLVGIMDRLEIDESTKAVRVIDYKWTQGDKTSEELLTHYQLQLQLYTWAACKMLPFVPEIIEATILHLTSHKIQEVKLPQPALDLDLLEKLVHQLHSKTKNSRDPCVGDHCKFCDFKGQCPAFLSLARSV